MKETDVVRMFLARRENYRVSSISFLRGRLYQVTMEGKQYTAVVLVSSFEYYQKRYHIAKTLPTLIICFDHDTVCPIPVLSMKASMYAKPFELPSEIDITTIGAQRKTKRGCQVLLGMYASGMRLGQDIVSDLPYSTRMRYFHKVEAMGQRKQGKPVGLTPMKATSTETRAS